MHLHSLLPNGWLDIRDTIFMIKVHESVSGVYGT